LEERFKPFELVTYEETNVTEAFNDVHFGSAFQIRPIDAVVNNKIRRLGPLGMTVLAEKWLQLCQWKLFRSLRVYSIL